MTPGSSAGSGPTGVLATAGHRRDPRPRAPTASCTCPRPATSTTCAGSGVGHQRRDHAAASSTTPAPWTPPRASGSRTACRRGGTSIHSTGSSPGFISEAVPLVLASIQRRLDGLPIEEFADLSKPELARAAVRPHGLRRGPRQLRPGPVGPRRPELRPVAPPRGRGARAPPRLGGGRPARWRSPAGRRRSRPGRSTPAPWPAQRMRVQGMRGRRAAASASSPPGTAPPISTVLRHPPDGVAADRRRRRPPRGRDAVRLPARGHGRADARVHGQPCRQRGADRLRSGPRHPHHRSTCRRSSARWGRGHRPSCGTGPGDAAASRADVAHRVVLDLGGRRAAAHSGLHRVRHPRPPSGADLPGVPEHHVGAEGRLGTGHRHRLHGEPAPLASRVRAPLRHRRRGPGRGPHGPPHHQHRGLRPGRRPRRAGRRRALRAPRGRLAARCSSRRATRTSPIPCPSPSDRGPRPPLRSDRFEHRSVLSGVGRSAVGPAADGRPAVPDRRRLPRRRSPMRGWSSRTSTGCRRTRARPAWA